MKPEECIALRSLAVSDAVSHVRLTVRRSRFEQHAAHKINAPQAERAVLEVEPAAQSWQWCEPLAAAIDPAGQRTQLNVPGRDLA